MFTRLLISATLAVPTLIAVAAPADSASAGAPATFRAGAPFQQDCLKAHNTYRAKHGAPALRTDPQIVAWAQQWADQLAAKGTLQHRQPNKYGENLYMSWSSAASRVFSCADAVKAWYDEIKDYDFNDPDNMARFSKIGHFTQVVWKGSKRLGCAQATKNRATYLVCNYDPPGNMRGQFGANVPRVR